MINGGATTQNCWPFRPFQALLHRDCTVSQQWRALSLMLLIDIDCHSAAPLCASLRLTMKRSMTSYTVGPGLVWLNKSFNIPVVLCLKLVFHLLQVTCLLLLLKLLVVGHTHTQCLPRCSTMLVHPVIQTIRYSFDPQPPLHRGQRPVQNGPSKVMSTWERY